MHIGRQTIFRAGVGLAAMAAVLAFVLVLGTVGSTGQVSAQEGETAATDCLPAPDPAQAGSRWLRFRPPGLILGRCCRLCPIRAQMPARRPSRPGRRPHGKSFAFQYACVRYLLSYCVGVYLYCVDVKEPICSCVPKA